MVNLTFYNKPPPSNKPPGGLIEIQEKVENETVLNKAVSIKLLPKEWENERKWNIQNIEIT